MDTKTKVGALKIQAMLFYTTTGLRKGTLPATIWVAGTLRDSIETGLMVVFMYALYESSIVILRNTSLSSNPQN